ncbi:hypothetical protein B5M09_011963 [Aphanomyces astaci]|uniref:HTH psq-type domain-containing protein n=1 Tax=Aphanomyces astaci TaxID=112090 RepID=A0A425DMA2_APHAT|nr:hypothetical protein B5M09_011963 [Aphanomyces astaci]
MLQALGQLETMNDYEVAAELGVAWRTIRNWQSKRSELLAYKGNKKRMKLKPGGRPEVFRDSPGILEFIHGLRDAERALTKIHMVTWIKRNQRAWLVSYLANKKPGTGYNSLLLLLRRFSARLSSNDLVQANGARKTWRTRTTSLRQNFIVSIVTMSQKACTT